MVAISRRFMEKGSGVCDTYQHGQTIPSGEATVVTPCRLDVSRDSFRNILESLHS